jgi:hypothetical protein
MWLIGKAGMLDPSNYRRAAPLAIRTSWQLHYSAKAINCTLGFKCHRRDDDPVDIAIQLF